MAKKFGDFMKEFNEGGGAGAVTGFATDTGMAIANNDKKYNAGNTGRAVGGGIGTALGAAIGMPGVGQAVGSMIGGLIGAGEDKRDQIRDYDEIHRRKYQKLDLSANLDPYGSDNTLYMEDGGMVAGPQPQQPQRKLVNIEKGEILINPETLEVVRKYDNENRYKPHSKNAMKEAVGNFTLIDDGMVVIPKKYAERYDKGDVLSRKSIIAEILKNQRNNPEQSEPRVAGAPFAKDGYIDPPGVRPVGIMKPASAFGNMSPAGVLLPKNKFALPDVPMRYDPHTGEMVPDVGTGDFTGNSLGIVTGAAVSRTPDMFNPKDGYDFTDPTQEKMVLNSQGLAGADNQLSLGNGAGNTTNDVVDSNGNLGKRGNLRRIGRDILGALPTAYGLANAFTADPFLRYDENTQFDGAKAYAQGMETTPNIEASKAAIRRSSANRNRTLNNFNSPSTRAELAANNVDVLTAEGSLIERASNLSQELRNKKRMTLGDLEVQQGNSRLNMRQSLMNELRQDAANRQNLIQTGLSEGYTNYARAQNDDETIKALNSLGYFYNIDPLSDPLLADQNQFVPEVLAGIGRLKGGRFAATSSGVTTEIDKTTRDRVGNVKSTQNIKVKKRK